MPIRFLALSVLISVLLPILPGTSFALNVPSDIGTTTQVPNKSLNLTCSGPFVKIICIVKKVWGYIETIRNISKVFTYVPHSFPFGGPILASERACTFKFNETVWAPNPLFGIPPTLPYGPVPIPIPLGGRAIVVGPPVPTYKDTNFIFTGSTVPPGGWVIAFPWISKIYRNHTENRAGPWALGLGFSPFPLEELNKSLNSVRIWIPPLPTSIAYDPPCYLGGFISWGYIGSCTDNFRFDCKSSGEKDPLGNDIYKVIRKLGTSKQNAPATAFPQGYTLPLR